jgi:hypothetical protein
MEKKHYDISSTQGEIKETWIVIDNSTNKALYGLMGKTLIFKTKDEADNFGRQICKDFTSISITY